MQGVVAVLVIIGLLAFVAMRFIQKIVMKLIVVGALVGAGVFLYSQRSQLDECQARIFSPQIDKDPGDRCICGFLGLDITVPKCDDLLKDPSPG